MPEVIEETRRPPGLIFGMQGYSWDGSDMFDSWKEIPWCENSHNCFKGVKIHIIVNNQGWKQPSC